MTYRREGRKTFDGTTAEQEKEQSMGERKEGAKQNDERKEGRRRKEDEERKMKEGR